MDTKEMIERKKEIKKELAQINEGITKEVLDTFTKEELEEYIEIAEEIQAKLNVLDMAEIADKLLEEE